jgi:hypothetical protein
MAGDHLPKLTKGLFYGDLTRPRYYGTFFTYYRFGDITCMEIIIGTLIISNLFDSGSFFFLAGLISASMLFALLGIRFLRLNRYEGLMFLAMAVFFMLANVTFLLTESSGTIISGIKLNFTFWHWTAILMGPAVIILYLSFGIYNLLNFRISEAILKTLLAVSLIMILYTVGFNWPAIVKAISVLVFSIGWFALELREAEELH